MKILHSDPLHEEGVKKEEEEEDEEGDGMKDDDEMRKRSNGKREKKGREGDRSSHDYHYEMRHEPRLKRNKTSEGKRRDTVVDGERYEGREREAYWIDIYHHNRFTTGIEFGAIGKEKKRLFTF